MSDSIYNSLFGLTLYFIGLMFVFSLVLIILSFINEKPYENKDMKSTGQVSYGIILLCSSLLTLFVLGAMCYKEHMLFSSLLLLLFLCIIVCGSLNATYYDQKNSLTNTQMIYVDVVMMIAILLCFIISFFCIPSSAKLA